MRLQLCMIGLAVPLTLIACDRDDVKSEREPYTASTDAPAVNPSPSAASAPPAAPARSAGAPILETRLEAGAVFASVPKMKLTGDVDLDEVMSGVRIEIEVEGAPTGKKGVHIHQKDDCSDIPGMSMGGHFAPKASKHGYPTDSEHHLGDLGNMTVGDDGEGKLEIIVAYANLKPGDPMSLLGRAVVIHDGEDDGKGESGNSGSPIACAPIKAD